MLTPIGNPQMIRNFNEYLILELIVNEDGLSRAEISRRTGLSKPTVSSAVQNLLYHRLVVETGLDTNQQGRKGQVLEFNPQVFHVFLLDIGADGIQTGMTDLSGKVRHTGYISWEELEGETEAEQALQQRLTDIVAQHAPADGPIQFVSAGIPAVVDPHTGYVQTLLPHLERYGKLLSAPALRQLLNAEVLLDNDVNLAAVAEQEYGNGTGASSFIYVSLGEGVGTGIMIHGQIYRGLAGAAGEWGQAALRQAEVGTLATAYKRLEQYIGNEGLRELLHEAVQHIHTMQQVDEQMQQPIDDVQQTDRTDAATWTIPQLLKQAENGHPLAVQIMERYADRLLLPLAQMASLLAPERIVLGGQIAQAAGVFLPILQQALPALVPVMPELSASKLDKSHEGAIMCGAAWAGVQRSFRYIREEMLVIGGKEPIQQNQGGV
ncbi:ROK family transcriptional regulator [Paenibacillus wenxiniae]|uniref:ROK family transcriptional regulator n=1 Tax=Paenibacillus wenxiniae TaxID=1636843 RepID=A0ABW4RLR1_9BACL